MIMNNETHCYFNQLGATLFIILLQKGGLRNVKN